MSVMTTVVQQDNKQNNAMEELLKAYPKTFLKEGDLVDGAVLMKESARLYIDLGIFGTGVIYGREYQNAQKLIFSEKGVESEDVKKIVGQYSVGDVIEGEVTGIVEFGIFIKIAESLEGLAHISELDWALVEDPRNLFKVGDRVKAKII